VRFVISEDVFERFPGLRVVAAVADGVDNARSRPRVSECWRSAWREAGELRETYDNAQTHPHVRAWRQRFAEAGVSPRKFTSSIEAMLRRAMKGGDPVEINPLVDFIHSVSLRYVVPVGGFDLLELSGELELRLTREGDTFLALDAEEPEEVPPGEVAYAHGSTVLTRHFVWRQAKTGLVGRKTRRAILVSEVLGEQDEGIVGDVSGEFREGMEEHFGITPRLFVLNEEHPSVGWG
jgi:DNA/RNA-binding domain of Phe-tRNA-synthetase-like protein